MTGSAWLDPAGCPVERPPIDAMAPATRALHEGLDAHARRVGVAYLHPDEPTVQLDLLGSPAVIAWQERKAELVFSEEGCWSELPPLYGRYGTGPGARLIGAVRALEHATAAVVADSGMQATALVFDALVTPGAHAVCLRQVYNKSRSYLTWLAARVGGAVTLVDDGDLDALAAAIRPETVLVFAETFTNPLVRAQDPDALVAIVRAARATAPAIKLIVDDTIATPWGLRVPLLEAGVDVVVAAGTKAVAGQDRDLWGYVATRDLGLANAIMDLQAMRGGALDWRRATAILDGLGQAEGNHARRSASAARVAAFLAGHPKVAEVFHPSRPDHPDAAVIARAYARTGSMLSFRARGADEAATRHLADVLASTTIVRYALSFDGLATKVNHHKTVSEYFTADADLRRSGFDRLVRLAVGLEDADDLCACLNWALHHAATVTPADLEAWRTARRAALGLA